MILDLSKHNGFAQRQDPQSCKDQDEDLIFLPIQKVSLKGKLSSMLCHSQTLVFNHSGKRWQLLIEKALMITSHEQYFFFLIKIMGELIEQIASCFRGQFL